MTPTVPTSVAPTGLGGAAAPPRPATWHHWFAIVACLGIFVAAGLLSPGAAGQGGLTLAGFRLPESCTFLQTTGIPCPGCGLTRSCVAAVHGRFGDSLAFHPLGIAVLLYAAAQALRHALWLARPAGRATIDRWGGRLDWGLVGLPVLMLILWLPGFVHELSHRL
jgi:Protein of unknown function (DUF2752)